MFEFDWIFNPNTGRTDLWLWIGEGDFRLPVSLLIFVALGLIISAVFLCMSRRIDRSGKKMIEITPDMDDEVLELMEEEAETDTKPDTWLEKQRNLEENQKYRMSRREK